jgi:hypothetical protein
MIFKIDDIIICLKFSDPFLHSVFRNLNLLSWYDMNHVHPTSANIRIERRRFENR